MSEVAEQAAEVAADVVEESIDGVVETLEVVRNNPVAIIAAGVVGLAVGGVGGYFVAKKQLKKFYEDLSSREIAEAKEFYAGIYKTDDDGAVLTPQDVLRNLHGVEAAEALTEYQGKEPLPGEGPWDDEMDEKQIRKIEKGYLKAETVEEVDGTMRKTEVQETRNVFSEPGFDLEEEMKYRTPDKPYIITHDEYFENEKEYDMVALTYFEEDDTLVDERDQPIRDVDEVVGEDHLVRFGTASKDKNVVFVCNERLEIVYEITKSPSSYVKEVLGMLDEGHTSLKHSDQRDRRRAFRYGDE